MSTPSAQQIAPRPFLKWAGGKGRLIQQYSQFFPKDYKNYYEPFLGGGAVFFYLRPQRAFLTDINKDLIETYCCVRDQVEDLILLLQKHQHSHCQDYYYQMRGKIEKTRLKKAARFIYLNKTCFNGLYRENSKGLFNVPVGKYKNPAICNPELLRSVAATLQNAEAEIKTQGFEAVLDRAKTSEDFVYFDPPYYPLNSTSNFTSYSRYNFTANDQEKLRDVFAELAGRGVKVMLSNSDCPFIRELYHDFHIHTIQAARSINSDATKRGKITEVLVTKNIRDYC